MSKTRVLHVYMHLITANSKQYGVVQLNKRMDFILKIVLFLLFNPSRSRHMLVMLRLRSLVAL